MSNEALFFLSAAVDILFVFIAARVGRHWLLGTIIVNLMLVAIFGAKLITVFGLVTNASNVFYACVFFATYFIIERHDKQVGLSTIWTGFAFIVLFTALSQIAVAFVGSESSEEVNAAAQALFSFSPRIVAASMISYLFSQHINVALYAWACKKTHGKWIWVRSNGANVIGQVVDSSLFFSIAFFDLPAPALLQAIGASLAIKVFVVFIGSPLLSLDRYLGISTKKI